MWHAHEVYSQAALRAHFLDGLSCCATGAGFCCRGMWSCPWRRRTCCAECSGPTLQSASPWQSCAGTPGSAAAAPQPSFPTVYLPSDCVPLNSIPCDACTWLTLVAACPPWAEYCRNRPENSLGLIALAPCTVAGQKMPAAVSEYYNLQGAKAAGFPSCLAHLFGCRSACGGAPHADRGGHQ